MFDDPKCPDDIRGALRWVARHTRPVSALRDADCRLVGFFGCLNFAALRPEEAISLAKHNLSLPARGWGELHIERAEPYAGKEWTDSGRNRDQRHSSSAPAGRSVSCPAPRR